MPTVMVLFLMLCSRYLREMHNDFGRHYAVLDASGSFDLNNTGCSLRRSEERRRMRHVSREAGSGWQLNEHPSPHGRDGAVSERVPLGNSEQKLDLKRRPVLSTLFGGRHKDETAQPKCTS
jgi:hypothetical protein